MDEIFKVFVGIAGGHGPEGQWVFEELVSRTLHHNRRLRRDIASTLRNVWVKTPEGVILGQRTAVLLNSKAHDQIIEKTIRGLHFHHTGAILGDAADITVNWHHSLTKDMYDMAVGWATGVVGGGTFIYKFAIPPEEPLYSAWVFQFFGQMWSSGTVLPRSPLKHLPSTSGC